MVCSKCGSESTREVIVLESETMIWFIRTCNICGHTYNGARYHVNLN